MGDILVVVDMQNDFITGSFGTKEAQTIVSKVVEKIMNHNGEVYSTQDVHFDNYLETQEGKLLPVLHCIHDTVGCDIEHSIEKALRKKSYKPFFKSQFASPDLALHLQAELSHPSIELIGVCTDICVISNALYLKAVMPENEIIVDGLCCAGTTPEMHEKALDVMKSCQIRIV